MAATNEPLSGYFHRLLAQSPTEFWIHNATLAEAEAALAAGALCATTNSAYMSRLLTEEPRYVGSLIDAALRETSDADQIADLVYQKAIGRLQRLFQPLFEQTNGRHGYVAMQGDPRVNSDPRAILAGALRYRKLGENIIIAVPAWPAGADALEILVEREIPTIATLGCSVDQAVFMAETYRRALRKAKRRPRCYVMFIAGLLDTYLEKISAESGKFVSREALYHAGCEASRAAYRIYKSREYEAILLGGGARGTHHFTELVGGELAVSIDWSLAQQIIAADGPVVSRINDHVPAAIVAELESHLPDFRSAFRENSLPPEEFHTFGPVASFQNLLVAAMDTLLKAISSRLEDKF